PEHVQGLFKGWKALRQRFLVREPVQAHAASVLVGVAREAVFGKKRHNGALVLLPLGRWTCARGRTAAARCKTQNEEGAEDAACASDPDPEIAWQHGHPRRGGASGRHAARTTRLCREPSPARRSHRLVELL